MPTLFKSAVIGAGVGLVMYLLMEVIKSQETVLGFALAGVGAGLFAGAFRNIVVSL